MGKIKFGTDGWRAIIDKDFTFENLKVVAQSVADYVNALKDKKELRGREIVVGYDSRRNSKEYAETVASVLTGNKIKVILSDRITTTPAVSFAIKKRNLTGGVMITASHNPADYNGIKYKAYYSGSAGADIIGKMEKGLFKNKVKEISLDEAKSKGLLKVDDLIPDQLDFVLKYLRMDIIKKCGFKVLIDPMHGAGGRYMEGLLKDTNCKVRTIHAQPRTDFGGVNPEPIEKNLKELARLTKEDGYDIGIATDGDVDRVGCALPNGRLLDGQHIMALLLWHFVEDRKMTGSVVTTICGTVLFKKICEKYKLKLRETPVGFKYICDIMRKEDVLVGGEETGGIGFKDYIPERDGILSGLLLLEMMAHRKKGILEIMSDLEKEFGTYQYLRTFIKISEDKKTGLMSAIIKNPPKDVLGRKIVKTDNADGIKFMCDDSSWLLYRLSGTEPILRVYSEGSSREKAEEILKFGMEYISKF